MNQKLVNGWIQLTVPKFVSFQNNGQTAKRNCGWLSLRYYSFLSATFELYPDKYTKPRGKKLSGPFLWMKFDCLKVTEQLRRGSLLFTTKFPESPGTHLIDLGRMKGWFDLGATQWFWTREPWIENPAP